MVLANSLTSTTPLSALGLVFVTIASVLMQTTGAAAAERDNTATILARIRHAIGSPALAAFPHGVLIEGVAQYQGLSGPYTLLSDSRGRFVQTIRLARDQIVGFDGTTAWGVDWSGTPRACSSWPISRRCKRKCGSARAAGWPKTVHSTSPSERTRARRRHCDCT
jgi:hypothetical protein